VTAGLARAYAPDTPTQVDASLAPDRRAA
jgi:hypothetical protein